MRNYINLALRILESLDAAGCTSRQKIRYGILPQLMPNFASTAIYRFDINLRDATVLGLVGAGGIGAPLIFAMNSYRWSEAGAILVGLIVLVLIIEWISTKIRVKLALERCASYLELADGKPVISDRFLKPKIEHYNYDFYAGIDYAFDLRRPLGDRVVRLLRLDGTPIEEDGQYTLVCSDYRASGTGGYEMIGEIPVLWTGADNMQDLLIGYIREHALIKPAENVRFRVIWQ